MRRPSPGSPLSIRKAAVPYFAAPIIPRRPAIARSNPPAAAARSAAAFASNDSGAVLILFAPFLAIALSAFASLWALALAEQDRIALRYRLQVCAVRAVYASRGVKLIPGAAPAAQASESVALALLNSLRIGRESLIVARASQEALMFPCRATPFSKSPAWCRFRLANRSLFQDNQAAFPDVPKTVRLAPLADNPTFACAGIQGRRFFRESVVLRGDSALFARNFRHAYQGGN